MFANKYLEKNNNEILIETLPSENTGMVVVVPCYREPDILSTLNSLKACEPSVTNVEVIVLVNHSEIALKETKDYNCKTKVDIDNWILNNRMEGIQFFCVGPIELKKKWAGAGLARKKGMDEAVRRFNLLGKTDGIVVSLDADTLVDTNYLSEIENHFKINSKQVGATVAFEHQKKDLGQRHFDGIVFYEQYLSYYKQALDFSGYPYSMFTIGSAFAVRALAYVKRGGMNRRQAGEDFYFLQNLVQIGNVGEITTTKVYPSSRLSDRVPFGTGPILRKWMKGEEDLTKTYNFKAFTDLKEFFDLKDSFYKIDVIQFHQIVNKLPKSISAFILHDNFEHDLLDLNQNCSSLQTFKSRFFHKFNAFKILKYLNFAHEAFYEKCELEDQIRVLKQQLQVL
jgi:hypothetical protein